jgi:hypothetical protein
VGAPSVGSVTANLRAATTTEAQFGIGTDANFKGNIVPLAVGATYEENPTITYTPVQGERYAKGILSPVDLETLVLLLDIERPPDRLISVLIKRVNGLRNPMYGPPESRAAFEESIALLGRLENAGQATWTSTSAGTDRFSALVIHDYAPASRDVVGELLRRWGLPESLARQGRDIVLPVRLAFGKAAKPELNLQTRSVYDLIQIAAGCVEVPPEHAALGLPDPGFDGSSPLRGFLTIKSSADRPSADVLVAVRHRGYWFYVAANDGPSKLAFRLLQTLIGMRLAEAVPQALPALTIPLTK